MRSIVTISANLSAEQVHELAAIYSEGRDHPSWFRCELPESDPRLPVLLDRLRQMGMTPWEFGRTREGERSRFGLAMRREYEHEDYADVRYLRLLPKAEGNGLFRDEYGQVKMIEGQFPTTADFVRTPLSWVVVPDRVMQAIESERFRGTSFKPAVLVGGSRQLAKMHVKSWSSFGEAWWELTSDVVLPPLSPTMELYDKDGNRVSNADCSRGCYAREGFYVQPEFRYRAADLAKVESFDFARTAEVFGTAGHVALHRLHPLPRVLCRPQVEVRLDSRAP